ncbi:MAG: hypothetical protein BZY87_01905 [SAR202 cluster bacterium Io17-Chloro-G6]|nr:MAG: hypothetical protein BZY87_01905 [SAR202 cluster bacterium Io17-Chloro-G6]
MQLLSLVYWLLRRRLRHSWLLLAVTSFGILASVTIMSTGALYSRALGEAGLRHAVASFRPEVLDAQITAQNRPLGRADYLPLERLFQEASVDRLGPMLESTERFGRTQPNIPLLRTPTSPIAGSPLGRPFFLTGFAEHTRLTQGRWPESVGLGEQAEIETVIGAGTSRQLAFDVGDRIYLVPIRRSSERITLKIVGLVEPIDSREEYWMGAALYFDTVTISENSLAPLFVSEDDFFNGVGARYPTLVGDFGFHLFLDSGYLTAGNANEVKRQVEGLETDLNKEYPRTLVLSRLGRTVDEFNRALTLAKVPLYLYLSLVVMVVLYFLALITGTLGRSQAEEAGQLRSRGASVIQVSGVLAMAEGFVALAAMISGPFLAWLIVKFLLLETINPRGEFTSPIPLGLGADMFWMGALGGVMALLVLLTTAAGRAKMGTLESLLSRARPPTVPFLHRYYLDILAVLAVSLIWFQVRGRDGFVAEELASQGLNVDPTLLFGPVVGLLAAAVLLLRLLPLVVRFLAWVGARAGAAWFQFSLLRLARDPIPHASLAVILMLAAALGVFGATFQSSLSQGQSHQARYRSGGDIVLSGPGIRADTPEKMGRVAGVTEVSPVLRDSVTVLDGPVGARVNMLAVEPRALAEAAWFREDFSPGGLQEISRLLRPRPFSSNLTGTSIPLPEDTVSLGVWIDSSVLEELNVRAEVNMWARVMAATGIYRNIEMGSILVPDTRGASDAKASDGRWELFTGDLPDAPAPGTLPFELVSLFLSTGPSARLADGVLHLDDITAFGSSSGPDGLVIEGFESQAPWAPLANQGPSPDTVQRTAQSARSGDSGLEFSWQAGFTSGQRGIHLPPGPFPIPAIGGPGFVLGQQVRVKLGDLAVPVQFVGLANHFPTLYPGRGPFLLVDLEDYGNYVKRLPLSLLDQPSEMWLSLDPGSDRQQVVAEIQGAIPRFVAVRDQELAAELAGRNPLAGGGWDGLTIFSMVAIGIAVLLTLAVHALVSIRMGRMDLAVARVLGFSRGQFFLSLATERLIVAVLAIAAGAAMGYWPSLEILELVDLTPQGGAPVPPLAPSIRGWLMAGVLVGLLAISALSVGLAVVAARRLNPAEILRGGA